jgi:signal transduction histidine kinase
MISGRPRPSDLALAAAGAAALLVEGQLRANGGLPVGAYALAIVAAAPLAWRTRAPLAALAGVEIGAVLCAAAFRASWAATAVVLVQLYTVSVFGDRQRSVLVAGVTAVGVIVAIALIDGTVELTGAALRIALVFGAVAAGDTVRSRRALRAAARERADREQREREEQARRRAGAERLRIAQELHDTLAHSLVAINVRSSVALDLHDRQDPTAALEDIKEVSATALRDLRATLSLLRDEGDAAPTTPGFDLDALPGLLAHARSAGLQTELDIQLDGGEIPSTISGAAYRIVQEALTNVLRHADATSARVSVRASTGALDIDVTDDGRHDHAAAKPGLGLRGMAERSAALGGHIDAGPLAEHGWRVHAVLPLSAGERG